MSDITENDSITIKETKAPNGYDLLSGAVTLNVSKKIVEGKYSLNNATAKCSSNADNGRVKIHVNTANNAIDPSEELNAIYVDIYDGELGAGFDININKTDKNTGELIDAEAVFELVETPAEVTGNKQASTVNGIAQFGYQNIIAETKSGTYKYYIKEQKAPVGYVELGENVMIELSVTVSLNNDNTGYSVIAASANLVDSQKNLLGTNLNVGVDSGNQIILTVPNERISEKYEIDLVKVDEDDTDLKLDGAVFDVSYVSYDSNSVQIGGGSSSGVEEIQQEITCEGKDVYTITERETPIGYIGLENPIMVTVNRKLVGDTYIIDNIECTNPEKVLIETGNDNSCSITLKIKNKKLEGAYQLLLEKQDVNGNDINGGTFMVYYPGSTQIDNFRMDDKNSNPYALKRQEIRKEGTDEWIISELESPEGYERLEKEIHVILTKYLDTANNRWDISNIDIKDNDGNDISDFVSLERDDENNLFKVKVINKKIEGNYSIYFEKDDALTGQTIFSEDTTFKVTKNNEDLGEIQLSVGMKIVGPFEINSNEQIDTYTVEEIKAPEGYIKLKDAITFKVHSCESDGKYIPYWVETDSEYVDTYIGSSGMVFITIDNDKIINSYQLDILKIDADTREQLNGAKFEIKYPGDAEYKELIFEEGDFLTAPITMTQEGIDYIYIREKEAPRGYEKLIDELKIEVTKKIENDKYIISDCKITNEDGSEAPEGTQISLKDDSTITIEVPNKGRREYDLTLRKFITSINDKAPEVSREPVVDTAKLLDGSSTTATYSHTKEPLVVSNSDIVVYTLRMYNEGVNSAYVAELVDDIPEGLEYVLDNEINKKYGWIMYDEEGKETTDVANAKTIKTDYLSMEKSKERDEDNLLRAYDYKEGTELDYRDVQAVFKVVGENTSPDEVIINTAEITKETDQNGENVEDRDSTPNNGKEDEDDIDKEYLKLKYFDLSLLKWVSSTIITENGKTTETLTGHTGLENPEPVVKVELNRKKLDNLSVKFAYTIKVTNEGQIEGYAKEISDYIPQGLKFVATDNPQWYEQDGKIVTTQLENTLLQPGESAEISVILTWINGEDNLGLKTNVAEISKDFNVYGEKDIDSTPNNLQKGEDDIDNAPVLLSISTGRAKVYVVLITGIMIVIALGIILIKKFIL